MNLAKMRVLVVDDHAFTRLLFKEVLQSLGCAVENLFEAEDGKAALALLADTKVDLIFCDWQMQPMDGLTFMRSLRDPEKSANPYVPVVFCSAYTERDLIIRARDTGVTEIMTKPITAKAIEAKVLSVMKNPRVFVESTQYFGPDRRRRAANGPMPVDRRNRGQSAPAPRKPQ